MNRALAPFASILMTLSTLVLAGWLPVPAPAQTAIDLAYPRSSEKFFKQGLYQFELEIQRLQTPLPQTPLLTISPAIKQPRQNESPQQNPGKPSVQPTAPTSPNVEGIH